MNDDDMFLLDNNVLSHLSAPQRASHFFAQHCRVPGEVLREADGYVDVKAFAAYEYPMTARLLGFVKQVMATVPDDDTTLVDLYGNKGAADPFLVACALDATHDAQTQLFGPTWFVVSHDSAVRAKCKELHVSVLDREAFFTVTNGRWQDSMD